jgi:hypothetical protein
LSLRHDKEWSRAPERPPAINDAGDEGIVTMGAIEPSRKSFLQAAGLGSAGVAATGLGFTKAVSAATPSTPPMIMKPVRQVRTGELDIGYVDMGPAKGKPVLLFRGWPYNIHTYAEVAPILETEGYRVIVPHFRGYGATRFTDPDALRNGQQAALAADGLAMMDALGIESAIVGGCDWGARKACILAALWPER